jgi:O-antigen ligase
MRKPVWEIAYTVFSLLLISGSFTPLIYDAFARDVENDGDSNPIRLVLLMAVYGIALLLAIKNRQRTVEVIRNAPVVVPVLVLPLISVLWSVDPATTLKRAVAFLMTGIFCLYLSSRYRGEELLRLLLLVFFFGGLACFAYSLLVPQYGVHMEFPNEGNWQGIYGHKNELGRVAVIAILTAAFCLPITTLQARLRWATVGVFFLLVALSGSRTNWFILLGCAALIPALMVMQSKAIALGLRMALVVLAALTIVGMAFLVQDQMLEATGRGESLSGRLTLWRGVSEVIADKYPFWGAGYGTFFTNAGAVPDLQPYLVYWGGVPNHAHNGYLNTRADLGVPGLVVLVGMLVSLAIMLFKLLLMQPERKIWLCYAALLFAFLVNNYTESTAFKHSDIMWVLLITMYFHAASALSRIPVGLRRRLLSGANRRAPKRFSPERPDLAGGAMPQ